MFMHHLRPWTYLYFFAVFALNDCARALLAQEIVKQRAPDRMPKKTMKMQTLPKCKHQCGRRARTMRSTLCWMCFRKYAANSGARSAGNAQGNPGNAGNQKTGAARKGSRVVEGFRREGARRHYEAVRSSVEEHTFGTKWIKPEHGGHIADFLAHIVAASFASPELYDKSPVGLYDFLPCVFPHPNMNRRQRTLTAQQVASTLGPQLQHQILGLIMWRYHNTDAAWEELRPILKDFLQEMKTFRGCGVAYCQCTEPARSHHFCSALVTVFVAPEARVAGERRVSMR